MKIVVDADACPVKEVVVRIGRRFHLPVYMFFDTSHTYADGYSKVFIVDKGADSVDFAILKYLEAGDILVTQDYGLASMALAKEAWPIHQNGFMYTRENIDRLLFERHINRQARMMRKKGTPVKKRTVENDISFEDSLFQLCQRLTAIR